VNDAGVNVAARFGQLLRPLVLQLGKQLLHFSALLWISLSSVRRCIAWLTAERMVRGQTAC